MVTKHNKSSSVRSCAKMQNNTVSRALRDGKRLKAVVESSRTVMKAVHLELNAS